MSKTSVNDHPLLVEPITFVPWSPSSLSSSSLSPPSPFHMLSPSDIPSLSLPETSFDTEMADSSGRRSPGLPPRPASPTPPAHQLPSPPPTPVIPQSGLLSDDDLPLSRTLSAADDEDVLNTVLFQHLSPPTLIGVKNQRWVGPSLRRGVLICGVFASSGPSPS